MGASGSHDHSHAHDHGDASRPEQRRRLALVLGLVLLYMLAEVAGGLLSGSLALLADAGHMFSDAAALALSTATTSAVAVTMDLAWTCARQETRPPSSRPSFLWKLPVPRTMTSAPWENPNSLAAWSSPRSAARADSVERSCKIAD